MSHHSNSRPIRVEVTFSPEEYQTFLKKWAKACRGTYYPKTNYLRDLALEGSVRAPLNDEERELLSGLNDLGGTLSELTNMARKESLFHVKLQLKNMFFDYEKIVSHFLSKRS